VRALPRTFLRSALVTVAAAGLAAAPAAALSHTTGRGAARTGATATGERPGDRHGEAPKAPTGGPTTSPTPTGHPGDAGSTDRPPSGSPAAPPIGAGTGGKGLRWWPYGNVLHGAFTVDSEEHGIVQLVAQRGTVTAVAAGAVTVTSSDGLVLTWATSSSTRVLPLGPRRGAGLGVGAVVGVWGPGTPDAPTAAFVLVQRPGGGTGGGKGDGGGKGNVPGSGPAPTSTEAALPPR
jgi:hypothetical protein